jgi:hypothetical protein
MINNVLYKHPDKKSREVTSGEYGALSNNWKTPCPERHEMIGEVGGAPST